MAAEQIRKYSMIPDKTTEQQSPRPKKQRSVKKAWFTKGEKFLYTTGLVIIAMTMILWFSILLHLIQSIEIFRESIRILRRSRLKTMHCKQR
ncbi:hypothetical protein [Piscibacillus salipiscarius]|uniref:hypothetical protein n=1 Tax=Piscibacillus salipiscarius TaxID=299480 RepID=UPI0006D1575B|nr:hypothetical protein [Piscibacillus salipiscarius]